MDTLVALWRAAARTHGAAPLLRFEGRADVLTYGDVDARCRALAAQLVACGAGGGRGVLAVALCGGRDGWDVVALLACVFVDSVAEMLGAALGGAALYVPATNDLVAAAAAGKCGRLLATPSLLAAFLRVVDGAGGLGETADLALVVASGEALPPWLVAAFRASSRAARLVNVWGSTECAADACFADVTDHDRGDVPIGAPLDGGVDVVLESGELVVRGAALALGYAGPGGTLVDGGASGATTGPLADWRPRPPLPGHGDLFCLGRLDDVVQPRDLAAPWRTSRGASPGRRGATAGGTAGGGGGGGGARGPRRWRALDPRIWARCASGDPAPRSGPRAAAADQNVRYGLARRWVFPRRAAALEAGAASAPRASRYDGAVYAVDRGTGAVA
ncbi:hypothetical protein JL721_4610 [Aureococcus anophagefferens]|nr:hypothetical protein JL721_4610 [Aureococcus anophagefferens]